MHAANTSATEMQAADHDQALELVKVEHEVALAEQAEKAEAELEQLMLEHQDAMQGVALQQGVSIGPPNMNYNPREKTLGQKWMLI